MLLNLNDLQQPCDCGILHQISIKKIINKSGAIYEVQSFINNEKMNGCSVLICDTNTSNLLNDNHLKGLGVSAVITLQANGLHADEAGLLQLANQLPPRPTVLLAFGSGTIHDLTRYTAHELGIPFISIPTAASVDGFASTVVAMTFKGFKVTTPAVAPLAIFADPDIYAAAPQFLTASGIGDLLGKYTALLDWKVGHLLTEEPICEKVIGLTEQALTLLVNSIEKNDEKLVYHLMNGLILSGMAMQMVGTSRPASGAEHHLSHLWEMHVINKQLSALHGEKVGVGLLLAVKAYQSLLAIDTTPRLKTGDSFSTVARYQEIFKGLYEEVLTENESDDFEKISDEVIEKHFSEIQNLVRELPTIDLLTSWMVASNCKVTLQDLNLSDEVEALSLELAPYVRKRLTLLKLMKRFDV